VPNPLDALAVVAVVMAAGAAEYGHEGLSFGAAAVGIAAVVGSLFFDLAPRVMVSSTSAAYDLTIGNSASGSYSLEVMTVVTAVFFPLVLLYQGWNFYVFRARLTSGRPGSAAPPGQGGTPAAPVGSQPASGGAP